MRIIALLEPVIHWWERFSQANPGIGFMAFVYGAVLVIVWMFSRLRPARLWLDAVIIVIVHKSQPPLPPVIGRQHEPFEDDDSDSFAE
jgi:hypothetical protein